MSTNENIANNGNMTHEERIETMKTNLGLKFVEEAKKIIKNSKVIKGEDAETNFNTELNKLTFEVENIYPLNYEEFKTEFPKTIELVKTVTGGIVTDAVKKGLVLQGWSVRTNVDHIISNIMNNIEDEKEKEKEITLRNDVFYEISRMKDEFNIEWSQDLFWKLWKIKEGEARWNFLVKVKGESLAKKTIDDIRKIGGLDFIEVLQKEVYGDGK